MALTREQFEYLVEGSDEPVVVTIKPADRRAVAQENDLSEITVAEYYDRIVYAACVRSGLTDADFDAWFLTLDAGPSRVEGDEPGGSYSDACHLVGVALDTGQSICDLRELLGLPRTSPVTFDALVRMTRSMRVGGREAAEDAPHIMRRAKLASMLRA